MSKTSSPAVDAILTVAPSSPQTVKDTATVFNPAQSSAPTQNEPSQPYHHKANHNENRTIAQSGASGTINTSAASASAPTTAPKIGFVSLGCPKALVDSERIITELSRDGYQVASDYEGADLVVVNTCGFIESAVQESLDAIGEAISKNGKVIVTGCLGKEADKIRAMHPAVLAVTGAHAYD